MNVIKNIIDNSVNWIEARFALKILSFTCLTSMIAVGYREFGFSAVLLLLGLIDFLLLMSLLKQFRYQQRRVQIILRALVNGDHSMNLRQSADIRNLLDDINQRMQSARFEAEQQAHFLQMVLLNVDVAVLVFDEDGQVIESNPAVIRLLGKSINHSTDLGVLEPLVVESENSTSKIIGWPRDGQQDTLSIKINCVVLGGKQLKIVCLQSIREALQNRELTAYKQITKVLTHEVANSITPLVSLSDGCYRLLPVSLTFDDVEDKEDLALGLSTLSKRTEFLGNFIEGFRKMGDMPAPQLQPQSISELITRIHQLHYYACADAKIEFIVDIIQSPLVMIDTSQVEQVFINLVKNAIESVMMRQQQKDESYQGKIIVRSVAISSDSYIVEICDNGIGITDEVREKMFIPFFTTKQQGSGIGLSLSKQIMKEHGGDLMVMASDRETVLRCIFH